MMGHTDRATINQRRPMSEGMTRLLRNIARSDGYTLPPGVNSLHSQARALMDRGYVEPGPGGPGEGQKWRATDAGRAALELKS